MDTQEEYGLSMHVSFDNASDASRCVSNMSQFKGVQAELDGVCRGYSNYQLTGKTEDGHYVSIKTPKGGQNVTHIWPGPGAPNAGPGAPNDARDLLNECSQLDQQVVNFVVSSFPSTIQHFRVSWGTRSIYRFRSQNKIDYDKSYDQKASAHAIEEMRNNPRMEGM